jgi:Ser/Thr protein kinase RdoA (MazF antagonist)
MVFEDLGANLTSLVDPFLKGTAQEAEHALKLYATALGRLHADTVGCLDGHHETLQSVFGSGRPRRPPGWRVEKDAELVADRLGGTPPASELELLSSRLSDSGPGLTLVHGDPCPDNSLLVDQRIRLIDYEFARPSHALPVAIPLLDRRLEPHLDEGQDVPIDDAPGHALHQVPVRNVMEVLR